MGADRPSQAGIELQSPLVKEPGTKLPRPRVTADASKELWMGEGDGAEAPAGPVAAAPDGAAPDGAAPDGAATDVEHGPHVDKQSTLSKVGAAAAESLWSRSKVWLFILLWFALNIGWNDVTVKACKAYNFHWAIALWQLAFGWVIFVPLWIVGFRKVPRLTGKEALRLSPAALGHLVTHVGAVFAFGSDAPAFGRIVKAAEPVLSCMMNFLLVGEVLRWPVYATLAPIIGGVVMASLGELAFSWRVVGAAMASNVGAAWRAVYTKAAMQGGKIGEHMDAANTYAVMTIMSTFMLLPLTLLIEGPSAIIDGLGPAYAQVDDPFVWQMVLGGFFYYMFNDFAFLALEQLDPVSHAVANAMKRLVVISYLAVRFGEPLSLLSGVGGCTAIVGTLLYSLARRKFA